MQHCSMHEFTIAFGELHSQHEMVSGQAYERKVKKCDFDKICQNDNNSESDTAVDDDDRY